MPRSLRLIDMESFEIQHNYNLVSSQINDSRLKLWKLNRLQNPSLDQKKELLRTKIKGLQCLPSGLGRIFRFPLLSSPLCQRLIDVTDSLVRDWGWTRDRHANFPTTDLAVLA